MRLLVLIGVLFVHDGSKCSYIEEKKLYKALLNDYQNTIRPAESERKPIQVQFQIEILKLRSYELKEQVLVVTAFTMMHWFDPQLKWNPDFYDGKSRINFGSDEIWTPDIVLYNSAYDERESWTDTFPSKTIVLADGHVIWNMPVIWHVSCRSDITWFPVDEQSCTMEFGSWSYSRSQLKIVPWLKNNTRDNIGIIPNGEWVIKSTNLTYPEVSFSCCPESFSMVRYTVVFDHLSAYYFIYIILPMAALCFMFPMVFLIPIDSGERLGFGVTVILSITVYLLVISDKLPEKSDVNPMLGIIFVGEFFILCFGLMISAISMMVHANKDSGPKFLRKIARVSAKQIKSDGKVEYPIAVILNENKKQNEVKDNLKKVKTVETTAVRHLSKVKKYKEEWEILAKFLDRFGLLFTYVMIISFPLIVYLALPKSGLQ